eukprot:TRINITY_DN12281_c1_g9_i3.p1 TRINITY_DN12281_c1_g9~~TRINITY_DN12281_c1_g9_i3.p1  ORF type:complete len:160 (+),score=31.06 TRINITY_DN12281_c1_g9_i3:947-1426(+)
MANKRSAQDAEVDQDHEMDEEDKAELQTLFSEEDAETQSYRRDKEVYARNLKLLLDSFTPEQRERHEMYRRSKFKLANVKKIMSTIMPGINPDKTTLIVMAAIAKVYTGELVEAALDVQQERGHGGPLLPAHVREALRRLQRKGLTPRPGYKHRRFFTT